MFVTVVGYPADPRCEMSEHTDVEHPERDQRWNPAACAETETERLDRNWSSLFQELRVRRCRYGTRGAIRSAHSAFPRGLSGSRVMCAGRGCTNPCHTRSRSPSVIVARTRGSTADRPRGECQPSATG